MPIFKDLFYGISTRGVSQDGFVFKFHSFAAPHGRITKTKLRSADGVTGEIKVESRPKYDKPIDIKYVKKIDQTSIADYCESFNLYDYKKYRARISDGWILNAQGFVDGKYYRRRYVLGPFLEDVFANKMEMAYVGELANRFRLILDRCLSEHLSE